MALLEKLHPELNLATTVDNGRVLNQKLDEGLLDIAILAQPDAMRSIRLELLGRQRVSGSRPQAWNYPAVP
ncbi:DNA-binding transcriptional LysR family regulator [Devosia sp. 2618]